MSGPQDAAEQSDPLVKAPHLADADADLDSADPAAPLKQALSGLLMVGAGCAVARTAWGYGVGSLTAMGPGYFPALLGGVLIVIGMVMLAGLLIRRCSARLVVVNGASRVDSRGEPVTAALRRMLAGIEWRGGCCILGSIVAFVVLGQWGGLLPASFAVVFIAALGDRSNTLPRAAAIALVMTVISVVVFWWALQLQMPLLTWSQ